VCESDCYSWFEARLVDCRPGWSESPLIRTEVRGGERALTERRRVAGGACIRIGQSGLCPNTSDWKETVNGVRYSSSTIGDSSKFTEAMVGSTRSKWGYFDYEIESDSRDNNVRIPATENAPPRFGLWCLALALALTRSGFVSLLFKPSHTLLLPHSLFFFFHHPLSLPWPPTSSPQIVSTSYSEPW